MQTKPMVLIVDDTPANLSVLFELLSERGYEVAIAEGATSVVEQAALINPDLILLDVLMPGADGFTVCRELKGNCVTREIPVMFMTALRDTADKLKGFDAGAVDYITKPFRYEEVLARVATHLALERLKRALKASEARLAGVIDSALDAILSFDRERRIVVFNGAAERVFRSPARTALGSVCDRFLTPGLKKIVDDCLAGGQPARAPQGECALRADGSVFPVEASVSRTHAGDVICTLILRDVEQRVRTKAEVIELRGVNHYLNERAGESSDQLIGASTSLRAVMQQVRQVAPTNATVLINGETGTGKELIAQALHSASGRGDKPLIKLNCAALPANLIESELFGHEKGAFTGALARKPGRFELAHGGTLFLDETGELPLDLQAKLLRVLQEGEFERLGGTQTLKVDVRIIAATHRDLAKAAGAGQFRADLYYRLNVFPIALQPLRERKQDIPLLVAHFVRSYAAKYGKRIERLTQAQLDQLQNYRWPGNVRELQHMIERAVILSEGATLALGDWFHEASVSESAPATATLVETERTHIVKVLDSTRWRVSGKGGAAEVLGMKPTTLESRMKRLDIARPYGCESRYFG